MAGFVFTAAYSTLQKELENEGIFHVAFVDDIAIVAGSWKQLQHSMDLAQRTLHRLGLQLNVEKAEIAVVGATWEENTVRLPVTLPIPVGWLRAPPVRYHTPGGIVVVDQPQYAGRRVRPKLAVAGVTHLGHHIPASLEPEDAYQAVEEELDQALHQLHNRPIPFHGRIRVANQILIPKFTYR